MLNFLGVTENFAVIENIPYSMSWTFSDTWTGDPIPLDGVTFTGKIFVGDNRKEIEPHIVVVGCVGLPEGRWSYEVFCISDEGLKERMVSGYIGVIGSLQAQTVLDGIPLADRTLSVRLSGDTTRRLKLEWLSTSIAQAAAQSAWDAYTKTKAARDKITQAEGTLETLTQKADDAIQNLGKVDDLMDGIHQEVDRAHDAVQKAEDLLNSGILQGEKGDTPVIGANGHWWISGTDTGVPAEGKDGTTPHIGANGHWWIGESDTQIPAEGVDGMDANAIRRIYVASTDDLPEEGSMGVYYYIPGADGKYEVYAWVEFPDGESAWTPINESVLRSGTVKIDNTRSLQEGCPVQTNPSSQAIVRVAGYRTHGVVATGTQFPVTPHERPYILSLPVANDDTRLNSDALHGTLTINLHRRGFLRYTSGTYEENGLDFPTGRYLSFDYGTGLVAEEYTSSIEGITDTRCRLAVKRYNDIVFHDSYAAPDKGGSIRVGGTLTISREGKLDVRTASSAVLGGIKVGITLSIDENGILNAVILPSMDETSGNPASAKAVSEWIAGKKFVSESNLQGRNLVSENRLAEILSKYQKKMGVADIIPVSQEAYDALQDKSASNLYLIY